MNFFAEELNKLKENDCFREIQNISHREDSFIFVNNKKMLNLSSNDYLGLSTRKDLEKEFLKKYENDKEFLFSAASARLLTGTSSIYKKLENKLANIFQKDKCVIFNTGFQCNLGVISALAQKNTLILSDKLNHASIIAGMKLSGAQFFRYKHLDYENLEMLLKKHRSEYERTLIISESVFSMDGDIADIAKLIELKKKYNAMLMIDEAHAFGVFGENICGVCEEQGLLKDADVITATFGKSLASVGAFCVANSTIIDYLINKSAPFIFSTALAPVNVMWTYFLLNEKFEVVKNQQKKLQNLITQVNLYMNTNQRTQIIPFIIGDNDKTKMEAQALQDMGFYVLPIRPPTVPPNTSRLRISLTADITFDELRPLLDKLKQVK